MRFADQCGLLVSYYYWAVANLATLTFWSHYQILNINLTLQYGYCLIDKGRKLFCFTLGSIM